MKIWDELHSPSSPSLKELAQFPLLVLRVRLVGGGIGRIEKKFKKKKKKGEKNGRKMFLVGVWLEGVKKIGEGRVFSSRAHQNVFYPNWGGNMLENVWTKAPMYYNVLGFLLFMVSIYLFIFPFVCFFSVLSFLVTCQLFPFFFL